MVRARRMIYRHPQPGVTLMRRTAAFASLVAAMAALSAAGFAPADDPKGAPVVPPKQGKSETIQLFNGRDLEGWEGHKNLWSVKDGVIVAKNTEPIEVS